MKDECIAMVCLATTTRKADGAPLAQTCDEEAPKTFLTSPSHIPAEEMNVLLSWNLRPR